MMTVRPLKTASRAIADWRSAAIVLRQEQTPFAQYRDFGRKLALHPLMLMFFLVIPFSVISGFTPRPFRDLSMMTNGTIMSVAALAYFGAIWAWLGRWYSWGMAHNVPAVVISCSFYTVAHVVFHILFGGLVLDASFVRTWQRFTNTLPFGLLLTAMAVQIFAPMMRGMLSKNPSLVPVFWPISAQIARNVSVFDAVDIGKLRWMQAQQKGTRVVTDRNDIFVRRPLGDVVAQVSPKLGLQCHRSLWVAKSEVRDVVYLNGNPHVVLADEQIFPISRSAVTELRDVVLRRESQPVTAD